MAHYSSYSSINEFKSVVSCLSFVLYGYSNQTVFIISISVISTRQSFCNKNWQLKSGTCIDWIIIVYLPSFLAYFIFLIFFLFELICLKWRILYILCETKIHRCPSGRAQEKNMGTFNRTFGRTVSSQCNPFGRKNKETDIVSENKRISLHILVPSLCYFFWIFNPWMTTFDA